MSRHLKRLLSKRRHRLVRKWKMNNEFKKTSINEKLSVEFLSLTPADDEWHQMSISVSVWVKKGEDKNKKLADVGVYKDGESIAQWYLTGDHLSTAPKGKTNE